MKSLVLKAAVALAAVLTTAALGLAQQAQAALTVTVVVQPSCIVETTPASANQSTVAVKCAPTATGRVRMSSGRRGQPATGGPSTHLPTTIESGIARTTVRGGSIVQIDF